LAQESALLAPRRTRSRPPRQGDPLPLVLHPHRWSAFAGMRALALLALLSASNATELTPENFDKATEGKTVFIKFLAPW